MGKNKKSLRTALNSHQIKQKRQKAVEAYKSSSVKKVVKDLGKAKDKVARKSVIPYNAQDSVLLIGEGDFSFARALITEATSSTNRSHRIQLNPTNVTATALDSENMCYDKYPWAKQTVLELRQSGMEILFGVDATKLGSVKQLKGKRFDRVVFNFPHTGKGIADQDRNILSNQQVLVGFFKVAPSVLKEGPSNVSRVEARRKKKKKGKSGSEEEAPMSEEESDTEIHSLNENLEEKVATAPKVRGTVLITLRDTAPYTLWEMPKLAKKPQDGGPRYKQLRSFAFRPEDYPGYSHRRTAGHRGEREVLVLKEKDGISDARTWEFELI